MDVLIVEECEDLSNLWQRSLTRVGANVWCAHTVSDALSRIQSRLFDVIILDLICDAAHTMGVADFAAYRSPKSQVVFVTNTSFFQTGQFSIYVQMRPVSYKVIRRQKIWRRWCNTMRPVRPRRCGCVAPSNPAQD
jgi:CheY-like chemotaxis protein